MPGILPQNADIARSSIWFIAVDVAYRLAEQSSVQTLTITTRQPVLLGVRIAMQSQLAELATGR